MVTGGTWRRSRDRDRWDTGHWHLVGFTFYCSIPENVNIQTIWILQRFPTIFLNFTQFYSVIKETYVQFFFWFTTCTRIKDYSTPALQNQNSVASLPLLGQPTGKQYFFLHVKKHMDILIQWTFLTANLFAEHLIECIAQYRIKMLQSLAWKPTKITLWEFQRRPLLN